MFGKGVCMPIASYLDGWPTKLGFELPTRTKEVAHIEEWMESAWATITSRKVPPILQTKIERLLNKVARVVGQETLKAFILYTGVEPFGRYRHGSEALIRESVSRV